MGIPEFLIIAGLIFIGVVALKLIIRAATFLVGLGLCFIAAGFLLSMLTGQDLFDVTPTVGYVVSTINETVRSVPLP